MKKIKRRKRIIIVSILILVIALILYLLADRYLIDHVEKVVLDSSSANSNQTTKNTVTSDDWNYQSDNIKIKIDKVITGAGEGKETYYVADITLKDSLYLYSAFADDKFGRNIVEDTSVIATNNQAIFAINGDYYGFRSDGVLIRNGTLYRDVPARIGAAFFKNGTLQMYDETQISSSELLAEGVINTLSFGPVLVNDGVVNEDFVKVVVDTNIGNRSIQNSNPRTGIGMIAPNHYVFIVVDGRMAGYSKGMTLKEFAQVFADLGCTEAYNLDGGGSSTMYFMGRVVNNPLGKNTERPVSDILYIRE